MRNLLAVIVGHSHPDGRAVLHGWWLSMAEATRLGQDIHALSLVRKLLRQYRKDLTQKHQMPKRKKLLRLLGLGEEMSLDLLPLGHRETVGVLVRSGPYHLARPDRFRPVALGGELVGYIMGPA